MFLNLQSINLLFKSSVDKFHCRFNDRINWIFIIFFGLYLFFYKDTFFSLFGFWVADDSYSHGLLLLPITIFFLVKEIRVRRKTRLQRNITIFSLLGLCSLGWAYSRMIDLDSLEYLFLIILGYLIIRSFFGGSSKRYLYLPCFFLLLAIPSWWIVVPLLQSLTIDIVSLALETFRITSFIEGSFVTIPSGVFVIADGCSGLKYFLSGLLISLIIVYLSEISIKKTFLFMLLAFFLSLMANWLRVFIIILIGYFSEMKSGLVADHEILGWAIFFLVLSPIFIWSRFFSINDKKSDLPIENISREDIEKNINPSLSLNENINVFLLLACLLSGPIILHLSTLKY